MLRFKWHQTHTNEIKRLCYFLLIRQNLKCLVVLVNVSKDVLLLKHPVLRVMELSMSSIWVNVGDCSKIICTCRFRTNAKCNTLSDQLHAFVIKLVQNCALCMWRPLLRGKKIHLVDCEKMFHGLLRWRRKDRVFVSCSSSSGLKLSAQESRATARNQFGFGREHLASCQ